MKKIRCTLVAIVFVITCNAQDQKAQNVLDYFDAIGTTQQYHNAVDGMFEHLKAMFKGYEVEEEIWENLEGESDRYVSDVKQLLVPAYQAFFSDNDIVYMTSVWGSEAGKLRLTNPTSLSQEQKNFLSEYYNSPTGQKVFLVQEQLAEVEGKVSQKWSASMFESVMSKLAQEGFVLK